MPPKGKSTIKIAFFTIVALHVVVIGGMLMQGCSKDKAVAPKTTEEASIPPLQGTAPVDTALQTTTPPAETAPLSSTSAIAAQPSTLTATQPVAVQPVQTAIVTPVPATIPAATTGAKEYSVVRNDTLGGIAKKNHVTLKALEEANPGVDAKKLQIDQKLQIPAASVASVPPSSTPAATDAPASGSTYKVKSGDMLEKIAKTHGTTVKAIIALNGLKSANRLQPGQVLKMPAPKAAATGPTTTPAAPPSAAVSSPVPTTVASATPASPTSNQ